MSAPILSGLYAITSEFICDDTARLLRSVESALRGGAALVQYRDKKNPADVRERHATKLLALCHGFGRPLIVNDDLELAARVGADGVHLGAGDAPLSEARRRLPPSALLGVSCGASLPRALAAQAGGANYVAFGRFFASATKPDAPPAPPMILAQARAQLRLPLCAIGGITPAHVASMIHHGASLVAAIEGVFGASDIQSAAQDYVAAISAATATANATPSSLNLHP